MTIWWQIAGAVSLAAVIYGAGWIGGRGHEQARHERAVAALEARLERASRNAAAAETRRLQIERERDALRADLDAAGAADADALRRALGADSLRRIDAVRGEN